MIFISTLFYYTNYSIMDNNTTPDQFISSLPNELKLHIFEYLHIDIRLSLLLPYIHSIETVIRLHSSIHDFIIYYNQMHRNFRKLINHPSLKSTYYCRNFDLLNDYSSLTEHKHPIRDFLETILKTINGFLNSREGGNLVIGIADDGLPLGLEVDGFPNEDKMDLHLGNIIKERLGADTMLHIKPRFEDYKEKRVFIVECLPSQKPIYMKNGNEEEFYIRAGGSSSKLSTSQIVDYIKQRYPNN